MNFTFECPNVKRGCPVSELTLKNVKEHISGCKFYKFCCSNRRNTWSGNKNEIRQHLLECLHATLKCSKCCNNFTKSLITNHTC